MATANVLPAMTPERTKVTLPKANGHPEICRNETVKGTQLRIPKSIQLELARSLTFGVLGDDSKSNPSSEWESENQGKFSKNWPQSSRYKPRILLTSLDSRRNNPQTKQVFHLQRIDKKPICTVKTLVDLTDVPEVENGTSMYTSSFKNRESVIPVPVHRHEPEKPIEAIVPVNDCPPDGDARAEMLLPVCNLTVIPSSRDPHKYLSRKRRVAAPFRLHDTTFSMAHDACGVAYPGLEHPRMTSYTPGQIQVGDLPFENERNASTAGITSFTKEPDRISVTSLLGRSFTRRRNIPSRAGNIKHGFGGGLPETTSNKMDDRLLPFVRYKTII